MEVLTKLRAKGTSLATRRPLLKGACTSASPDAHCESHGGLKIVLGQTYNFIFILTFEIDPRSKSRLTADHLEVYDIAGHLHPPA